MAGIVGDSTWFCAKCQKHFIDGSTPICPNCGESIGKWTDIIPEKKRCAVCGEWLNLSYRLRLDRTFPNGVQIKRQETHEILEHFSQNHPDILAQAINALSGGK